MGEVVTVLYGAALIGIVVLSVFTLKLTRRQRGFKSTPMDFLILFMALVFPYLLGAYLPVKGLPSSSPRPSCSSLATKWSMGELRGRIDGLALAGMASLLAAAIRGFTGGRRERQMGEGMYLLFSVRFSKI